MEAEARESGLPSKLSARNACMLGAIMTFSAIKPIQSLINTRSTYILGDRSVPPCKQIRSGALPPLQQTCSFLFLCQLEDAGTIWLLEKGVVLRVLSLGFRIRSLSGNVRFNHGFGIAVQVQERELSPSCLTLATDGLCSQNPVRVLGCRSGNASEVPGLLH